MELCSVGFFGVSVAHGLPLVEASRHSVTLSSARYSSWIRKKKKLMWKIERTGGQRRRYRWWEEWENISWWTLTGKNEQYSKNIKGPMFCKVIIAIVFFQRVTSVTLSSNFQKMHQTYQFDSVMLKLSCCFFVLQEAVRKELNILLNRIFFLLIIC